MAKTETGEVKDFFLRVAGSLLAAAVLATAAALWKMNDRLARIETVLEIRFAGR